MIQIFCVVVTYLIFNSFWPDIVVNHMVVTPGIVLELIEIVGNFCSPFVFETEDKFTVLFLISIS